MRNPSPDDGSTVRGPADYLKVLPQYVLPQRLLSRLMHRFSRTRWRAVKDLQIGWFRRHFGIELNEAAEPDPSAYPHLNAFFTRALRPGARGFRRDAASLLAPADGTVSAVGTLDGDTLLQAKGRLYSTGDLLADPAAAETYEGGAYLTVYLSPRDYHRVHMPASGRLTEMRYLPGRLFSVNASTSRLVPRLFGRNERVVARFETDVGDMAIVLVGALMVGGIETVWAGAVTPPHGRRAFVRAYPDQGDGAVRLARGQELGRFNMGSTVILLFQRDRVRWDPELAVGSRVEMGRPIGQAIGPARADTV